MEADSMNPKDSFGIKKVPYSTIPTTVMAEVGVGMAEGALKYGRHNYRVAPVRASIYYDATVARHLALWWEGEDIDPDSGLHHVTKAIASLVVLRDAIIQGSWVDDRPPSSKKGWMNSLNDAMQKLHAKYPDAKEPYTIQTPIWTAPVSQAQERPSVQGEGASAIQEVAS